MSIQPAQESDFHAIVRLLDETALPHADLTPEHLAHFLVARDGDTVVGVVGMEARGDAALLRSLAVAADRRGGGWASRLVDALEARARESGIRTLYLLTTTAEGFFARRGYQSAERDAVPDAIRATEEFRGICPASAVCMARPLVPMAEPVPVS
ncbi:arsenic resistance N-acetyltransferase ArsN2 [Longimicrobium sp.]|uniref:arsenic resistance N-acetyltransferase ArsN2 n=1 Tax=Longimicrobium sp. TaxID=2029185 RepID=UPI002E34D2C4|nr:arsenic resistance N-acetyltransferase ArsN2 [Longimicrobium sp.]HEX6037699.1 arsenic resistance N-acetyltransferase ArsN2 [Longimicrobium sp.]